MPEDLRLADLEILKALHQANFNRWEKRRNYEWLLSYSIWGALAGFIGIVALGKDSTFRAPGSVPTIIWLSVIAWVHGFYLFFIVDGTLRDLDSQRLVE